MAYTDNVAKWFELYYRADDEKRVNGAISKETGDELAEVAGRLTEDEIDTVYKIF